MMKSDRIRFEEALKTRQLGREARWFDHLPSTNDAAKKWADAGAPHGALVFTDHQTGGRGRHGRAWITEPGLNLTVSLVLRPSLSPSLFGLITLGAGLAVRDSVESCCPGVTVRIKWPNDILIEKKKCCGMLLESAIGKDAADSYVVLGIGLNVNQDSFPEAFSRSATSLMLGYGRPVDRILLLADLLGKLEWIFSRLEGNPDSVVRDYERTLDGIGSMFRMTDARSGDPVYGVMRGIDASGALILETDSKIHIFHAGDVQMLASV